MKRCKLDSIDSARLDLLRFPLIIGVLFIHNSSSIVSMSDNELAIESSCFLVNFIREYISHVLSGISVPLFFLLSGYLFYYGFKLTYKSYYTKFKSRIRSLLLPFLFWNLLVLVIYSLVESIPFTAKYLSGNRMLVSSFQFSDYINAIFGISRYPIAYQFWFIRDLMVIVLLVPVIHIMLNIAPYSFLIIFLLDWIIGVYHLYIPVDFGLLFFYCGALFAYKKYSFKSIDSWGISILIIYFIFSLLDISMKSTIIHKVGIILGVAAVLHFSKYLAQLPRVRYILMLLSPMSFFVYASHEPLLTIIKKIIYRVFLPSGSLLDLILFISIPFVVIVLCIACYYILNRVLPHQVKPFIGIRQN